MEQPKSLKNQGGSVSRGFARGGGARAPPENKGMGEGPRQWCGPIGITRSKGCWKRGSCSFAARLRLGRRGRLLGIRTRSREGKRLGKRGVNQGAVRANRTKSPSKGLQRTPS